MSARRSFVHRSLFYVGLAASPSLLLAANQPIDVGEPAEELVRRYFRSADRSERAEWADKFASACEGNLARAAALLRGAALWEPLPKQGSFDLIVSEGITGTIQWDLPQGYDPARAWPVALCLVSELDSRNDTHLDFRQALRRLNPELVLITSPQMVVRDFCQTESSAPSMLRKLIYAVRRRIHIDSDRVYLTGERNAGGRAWIASLTQSDLFAGVIVADAYPQLPYAQQLFPYLLANLHSLPIVTTWTAPPLSNDAENQGLEQLKNPIGLDDFDAVQIAVYNRGIAAFASQARLPLVAIESSAARSTDDKERIDRETLRVLSLQRAPFGTPIAHWFRDPTHGTSRWLRLTRIEGEAWTEDQLSILPSRGTDRDTFIRGVLEERLLYLQGSIDGQIVTVHTRRSAEIELLLPLDGVDWDKPITLMCNGRRRSTSAARPSIHTMLEVANEEWDFQRLVAVRLKVLLRDRLPRRPDP